MNFSLESNKEIEKLIDLAFNEDLRQLGDITSNSIFNSSNIGEAAVIAKQKGVIAGLAVAERVFKKVDSQVAVINLIEEGAQVKPSDEILKISGSVASILTAERTALNFLQRLSGIATLTAKFVQKVESTKAKILDTRKTTPALRALEKYAVQVGGGCNHRFGLHDMVLIKENHIAAAGGMTSAVKQVKENLTCKNLDLKIEVEVRNLQEVKEALDLRIDRLMLDNMSLEKIREAVELVGGRIELEVSGGVNLNTVRGIADTGVDFISVGALTHSACALDLSLLIN